jgi:lysophospholipase L1-like esterase
MRNRRPFGFCLCAVFAVACGSSSTGPSPGDGDGNPSSSGGASGGDSGVTSSTADGSSPTDSGSSSKDATTDASGTSVPPTDASVTKPAADSSSPGMTPTDSGSRDATKDAAPDASATGVPPTDAGASKPPTDASGTKADASPADASSQPAVTVWLAGDSTVENYPAGNAEGEDGADLEGWGQELGQFFNAKVTVDNQAIGGRSVADFIYSVVRDDAGVFECIDDAGDPDYQLDSQGNRIDPSQWATIKAGIKPGDFLLIQFGTNDETHDCPRFVSLPNFEADLGIMADTIRAKGATPIFVTPMGHREFNSDGTVNDTLLPYANAMKSEATLEGLEVADLNLASVNYYAMVGNTFLATNIFDGGTTHFVQAGAIEMASLVAGELRKDNGPLAAYLK